MKVVRQQIGVRHERPTGTYHSPMIIRDRPGPDMTATWDGGVTTQFPSRASRKAHEVHTGVRFVTAGVYAIDRCGYCTHVLRPDWGSSLYDVHFQVDLANMRRLYVEE